MTGEPTEAGAEVAAYPALPPYRLDEVAGLGPVEPIKVLLKSRACREVPEDGLEYNERRMTTGPAMEDKPVGPCNKLARRDNDATGNVEEPEPASGQPIMQAGSSGSTAGSLDTRG
ncbi:hypothetical protein CRG98_007607 [Punica granatum]|uniref:Uncharacterized protein n=1 Tax=Punica granatum TaxID=22663 RepID=A0A2I0KU46_PUNGR|nr:hypothetical protein CRG98_007607 [Punica granatum]